MNDLSDLILIIDSREKEQKRINSMRSFFEERGAVVDVGAITIKDGNQITSMDYSIEGSYKGKSVNLGISAKSLVDFSGTIGNLSNELARGFFRFDEVGFILITGCYQTTLSSDGLHAVVRNPAVQDGSADILNTTSMFNALSSWERSGIHCRQILYEEQFSQAVISILNFITKDHHEGLNFCTKAGSNLSEKAKMDFTNTHTHLGISGFGVKTALKLWDYLVEWNYPPNLHFASSLSEEDLIDALGVKIGKTLYEAYRNRNGWIDVKKSSKEANRSSSERKLPEPKGDIPEDKKKSFKSPLNQSDSKIITDGNKLQAEVLNLIESYPKGIPYTHVVESFKQDESEIYDIIAIIMQEGKCYEPRLGLLVPTNHPSQSSTSTGVSHTDILSSSDIHVNDVDDKLQSSSVGQLENQSAEIISQLKKEPDTPDTLQSSEVSHTPKPSVDTAEGTILTPLDLSPPAGASYHKETVKSLEDAIVDRVYSKPEIDTVIMREFMNRGFQMPEIHWILKDSVRLHRYKQGGNTMIAYKGVRADKEMDVGV